MELTDLTEAQQRARATWSAGDYDAIVDYIWSVGGDLVGRVGVNLGDEVLDVACGTGNAAIPAAQAGGKVTGLDLTPALFDAGRRRAAKAGVELEWVEGDAQALPFDDASFDVVLSTFGCMFAPDHERAAAEIARVLKPGGRFGIAAWDPEGNIGKFFASMAPFAPEPPPGFQPPPLWGTRDHVSGLFDGTGVLLRFEDAAVDFQFDSVDAAAEEYWENFGPVVMLRQALEPEGRGEELRAALRKVFEDSDESEGDGIAYPGEYLITLGEKND
jgi:SAM-dependent methyltransferase